MMPSQRSLAPYDPIVDAAVALAGRGFHRHAVVRGDVRDHEPDQAKDSDRQGMARS